MTNKKQINKSRKIGAWVAYATLACGIVSVGLYLYKQQQKSAHTGNNGASRRRSSDQSRTEGQDQRSGAGQNDGFATEAQASSLSRLGSKIARTVKRNRRVMTISLKNTILWNPSPDPTAPNYGFVEGAIPLLFHLAENYNLHLILLCPPLQQLQQQHQQQEHQNNNDRAKVLTVQEQDQLKQEQQLYQEREKEQILTMLRNAGLISSPGTKGPRLIDPRQFLICETEEGVGHVVRHLESYIHVEARPNVVDLVQGVVPRVVFVQKKAGHSRGLSSATEELMTQSHVRVRSSSSSSSTAGSGPGSRRRSEEEHEHATQDVGSSSSTAAPGSQWMGDSFVEVLPSSQHEPLVSGYVTQAGKKGYLEVTDQLMHSSLNPEFNN
ncbi:hypothetical protein EMPS_07685 [Entomortierella parvispora]|uniref:Uncharacterized protein n=1 Tax=Entomortierella parvispora TaxID=205924 RepID=A0A9P3HEV7_9FUNG|nr:hypothetical protein EMPS_07685 [Entomortierella parvispora]